MEEVAENKKAVALAHHRCPSGWSSEHGIVVQRSLGRPAPSLERLPSREDILFIGAAKQAFH